MSKPVAVNPELVINRLSQQVGSMAAELAMRDAALEAAHARIAELEEAAAGVPRTGDLQDPPAAG